MQGRISPLPYPRKEKDDQGPIAMAAPVAQQSHATRYRLNEGPI